MATTTIKQRNTEELCGVEGIFFVLILAIFCRLVPLSVTVKFS
jgi:hypothetical protein